MPVTVRKQGNRYAIVEKDTGKAKGHSSSKAKAQSSARARTASKRGWKPSK